MADAVLDGDIAAALGGDGRFVVGKEHGDVREVVPLQPVAGHIRRCGRAGRDDLHVVLAQELDDIAQELLRALGRVKLGGGAVVGIDPVAHGLRHVQSGGIDEGALRQIEPEFFGGRDGERARMFGEDPVEVDGEIETGSGGVPIR